ncbi:MAG TPA: hypothetical protein VH008_14700 [Pseudonocardia sp.]|nr:hypothetical protein [Pseudonocardia sp.]
MGLDEERHAKRARLRALWQAHLGGDPATMARFDAVVAGYDEPHRRSHDLDHLLIVVETIVELAGTEPVADLPAVVAAGFYHDVIYEPLANDNEARSADRAEAELSAAGLGAAVLQHLLEHERQFATRTGQRRWDSAARDNLARELAELDPPPA